MRVDFIQREVTGCVGSRRRDRRQLGWLGVAGRERWDAAVLSGFQEMRWLPVNAPQPRLVSVTGRLQKQVLRTAPALPS